MSTASSSSDDPYSAGATFFFLSLLHLKTLNWGAVIDLAFTQREGPLLPDQI